MMKAAPASSFIVAQSEFLLQFLVVALDNPALRWAGKVDNQYRVGSTSCLGHSINSHSSERASLLRRQNSRAQSRRW
jgi:hypothetical protein